MRMYRAAHQHPDCLSPDEPQQGRLVAGNTDDDLPSSNSGWFDPDLAELLVEPLKSLIEHEQARACTLWLPMWGTLKLQRNESDISWTWSEGFVRPSDESRATAGPGLSAALPYAASSIGLLRVYWRDNTARQSEQLSAIRQLARQCAYLVKRAEASAWAFQELKRPMRLIGHCTAVLRLERFIEKAAWSPLPVLILGEFGTEKTLVASSVHSCGPDRKRPFIVIHCRTYTSYCRQTDVTAWLAQADGGTLFLDGIDELPLMLQRDLLFQLDSRLGRWRSSVPGEYNVRIIASAIDTLHERVKSGQFLRELFAELNWLTCYVPPLHQRLDDIDSLALWQLRKNGFGPDFLSPDLLKVLKSYQWPDNLIELERLLVRLAVMTDGPPISLADLHAYAQHVVDASCEPGLSDTLEPSSTASTSSISGTTGTTASTVESEDDATVPTDELVSMEQRLSPEPSAESGIEWARRMVVGDMTGIEQLHPSLRRAMVFLSDHYVEPIALGELAKKSYISPSHLSYLFKQQLGLSFKPFLCHMRLIRAQHLLAGEDDLRITDVALDAGFNDLSHFEKMFRRFTSLSPSEYQAAHRPST